MNDLAVSAVFMGGAVLLDRAWQRGRGRGLAGNVGLTRAEVFEEFKNAVRHVWTNADFVLPVLSMSEEAPAHAVLASIAHPRTPLPLAIGRSLLRRSAFYTLRVSDAFLTRSREDIRKTLLHEAVHIGYGGHGDKFREMAREVGATVSGSGLDTGGAINIQMKMGARYATVRTFGPDEEKLALQWARERAHAAPGTRWRMTQ